jgi:hypothetical protein|tara:strand:+ start:1039 stop:1539 length:501 start_codon:yes stop_codon:yes gene_type:complete
MVQHYKPPVEFQTENSKLFEQSARKFIVPTKRRARRHFDEELAFFTDRFERWLGCKGSNFDFSDMNKEQQDIAFAVHRGLVWLRVSYADHLLKKVSNGVSSYLPHDWRPRVKAVREHLIELHNSGENILSAKTAKLHHITRKDVLRDFERDDPPSRKRTESDVASR